jgi:hypothetical protein
MPKRKEDIGMKKENNLTAKKEKEVSREITTKEMKKVTGGLKNHAWKPPTKK